MRRLYRPVGSGPIQPEVLIGPEVCACQFALHTTLSPRVNEPLEATRLINDKGPKLRVSEKTTANLGIQKYKHQNLEADDSYGGNLRTVYFSAMGPVVSKSGCSCTAYTPARISFQGGFCESLLSR